MSYLQQYKEQALEAWKKAFWYFAGMNYTDKQCEFYADAFQTYYLENMGEGSMEDLLTEFVADVRFSEQADKELRYV